MKIGPRIARRIFWNIVASLFIYALPIVLMFLYFYFIGERPWEKNAKQTTETSINK